MSELVGNGDDRTQQGPPRGGRAKAAPGAGGGFALKLYKPRQGYYTRMGTALGLGVISVCGAMFLHHRLADLDLQGEAALYVQYGVASAFLLATALLIYWVVGLNHRANDFFIATEGEMKKVRWSTKKEVIRSTKVVIVSVIILSTFLFAADLLFMLIFSSINVLKGPSIERIFGGGS